MGLLGSDLFALWSFVSSFLFEVKAYIVFMSGLRATHLRVTRISDWYRALSWSARAMYTYFYSIDIPCHFTPVCI